MAGSIDLLVADIERIGTLVAELIGLDKSKTPDKITLIRSIYENGYNINPDEISLKNKTIQEILQSKDTSTSNIQKISNLINTIEVDMNITDEYDEKKEVLKHLLTKIITLDTKNYSIERIQKLEKLNQLKDKKII